MSARRVEIPAISAVLLVVVTAATASATSIDLGDGIVVNLDNTFELTLVDQPHSVDFGPSGRCLPDNGVFAQEASLFSCASRGGLTSTRSELISRLTTGYENFGLQVSTRAVYDPSYSAFKNKPPSMPATANLTRLFSDKGEQDGEDGFELSDAFISGNSDLGLDLPFSFRLGRQVSIWGESLYFPQNGIAAGQAPIDTFRYQPTAGYLDTDTFLPVAQLTFTLQPSSGVTILGYYQFEWRRSRISPYDAEDSTDQILKQENIDQIILPLHGGRPVVFNRITDITPLSNDQFGVGLKLRLGDYDLGIYGQSYNAKTPELDFRLPVTNTDENPRSGTYELFYARDIEAIGVSLAGPLFGDASFGAEISARRNQPLVSPGVITFANEETGANDDPGNDQDRFPTGNTFQAQFSWMYTTPPLPGISGGANFSGEIAGNALLDAPAERNLLIPNRTAVAAGFRTVFEPQFFQVLPRVDLTVPISFGYNFLGLSEIDPTMNRGTGDLTIGATATLDEAYRLSLSATHYIGVTKDAFLPTNVGIEDQVVVPTPPLGLTQALDRQDFIALNFKTSF